MFAAAHRLSSSRDIERVIKSGVRIPTEHTVLYGLPASSGASRVACVVGKKVHKSAVIRHRIQRRLRAACREALLTISGAYDIVVIARGGQLQLMDMKEIVYEITEGFRKLSS